jgi:hypothetical protein
MKENIVSRMYVTLRMLVMMSCVAGAQIASAQTQSVASPGPAATNAAHGDVSHAPTMEAAPTATTAPPAATPVAAGSQTAKKAKTKKNNDTANMQPDDPRKSPYWEPRDSTYIYNQGP